MIHMAATKPYLSLIACCWIKLEAHPVQFYWWQQVEDLCAPHHSIEVLILHKSKREQWCVRGRVSTQSNGLLGVPGASHIATQWQANITACLQGLQAAVSAINSATQLLSTATTAVTGVLSCRILVHTCDVTAACNDTRANDATNIITKAIIPCAARHRQHFVPVRRWRNMAKQVQN